MPFRSQRATSLAAPADAYRFPHGIYPLSLLHTIRPSGPAFRLIESGAVYAVPYTLPVILAQAQAHFLSAALLLIDTRRPVPFWLLLSKGLPWARLTAKKSELSYAALRFTLLIAILFKSLSVCFSSCKV